jgi:CRISPR-associated endonuclease/helicase Cas3
MHVVLICASEKRAIARTAAVLDAYALRIGDRTWQSPMTVEGLAEVRAALRRSASKSTAVACWRNDGRTRMRLLWTVGRAKTFARDGAFAVATRTRKVRVELPGFARAAAVIANASGLAHDLGKYAEAFQNKLHSPKPIADAIRHEWLSAALLDFLDQGDDQSAEQNDFSAAWQSATESAINRRVDSTTGTPFEKALGSARDALKFAVVTHHRCPMKALLKTNIP